MREMGKRNFSRDVVKSREMREHWLNSATNGFGEEKKEREGEREPAG